MATSTDLRSFERYQPFNNHISTQQSIDDEQTEYFSKLDRNELRKNPQFIREARQRGLNPSEANYEIQRNRSGEFGICLLRRPNDPGVWFKAEPALAQIIGKFYNSTDSLPAPTDSETPSHAPQKEPAFGSSAMATAFGDVSDQFPRPDDAHQQRVTNAPLTAFYRRPGRTQQLAAPPVPPPGLGLGGAPALAPAFGPGGGPPPPPAHGWHMPVPRHRGGHSSFGSSHKRGGATFRAAQHPPVRLVPAQIDRGGPMDRRISALEQTLDQTAQAFRDSQRELGGHVEDSLRGLGRHFEEQIGGIQQHVRELTGALAARDKELARLQELPQQLASGFHRDLEGQLEPLRAQLGALDKQSQEQQAAAARQMQALQDSLAAIQRTAVTHDELGALQRQLTALGPLPEQLRGVQTALADTLAALHEQGTQQLDQFQRANRKLIEQMERQLGQYADELQQRQRAFAQLRENFDRHMAELHRHLPIDPQQIVKQLQALEGHLARLEPPQEQIRELQETRKQIASLQGTITEQAHAFSEESERARAQMELALRQRLEARQELAAAQKQIGESEEAHRRQLTAFDQRQRELEGQVKRSDEDLHSRTAELERANRELEPLRKKAAELEGLQGRFQALLKENERLTALEQENRRTVEELGRSKDQAAAESRRIQGEIEARSGREKEDLQRQLQEEQRKYRELTADHEKAGQELRRLQRENPDLSQKLLKAEEGARQLQLQLTASSEQNRALEARLKGSEEEVARLRSAAQELDRERENRSRLERQIASQQEEIDRLRSSLGVSEQSLGRAQKENMRLLQKERELQELQVKFDEQARLNQELTAQIATEKQAGLALKDTNREITERLLALQAEFRLYQEKTGQTIQGLQTERNGLKHLNEELQSAHGQAKEKLEQSERRVKELEEEVDQLRSKLHRLTEQHQADELSREALLEEAQKAKASFEAELQRKQGALETLERRNMSLRHELDEYQQFSRAQLTQLKEQLEAEQLRAKAELVQARGDFERGFSEMGARTESRFREQEQTVASLLQELEESARQIEQLESHIPDQDKETQFPEPEMLVAPRERTPSPPPEPIAPQEVDQVIEHAPPIVIQQNVVPYLQALRGALRQSERKKLHETYQIDFQFFNLQEERKPGYPCQRHQGDIDSFVRQQTALAKSTPHAVLNSAHYPLTRALIFGVNDELRQLEVSFPQMAAAEKRKRKSLIIAVFWHCVMTTPDLTEMTLKKFKTRAHQLIASFTYDQAQGKYFIPQQRSQAVQRERQQNVQSRLFIKELIKLRDLGRQLRIPLDGPKRTVIEFTQQNLPQIESILREILGIH